MSLMDLLGNIKDGLLSGIDNGAQNALGPQAGLLAQNPMGPAQSAPPQPNPDQRRQMRASFLGNIGAALQTGQPVMNGIQNYQQQQIGQMQAAHQVQMQQRQQQLMGAFSQDMQAAGDDQAAQAKVIAKYAPYLPAQDIKGMASILRVEKPQPVGIDKIVEGVDPNTKQPTMFAVMKDNTVKPLGITPKADLVADGQGNIYDKTTKEVVIPSDQRRALDAFVQQNGGDFAKGYAAFKQASAPQKVNAITNQELAVRAQGGTTGNPAVDGLAPAVAAKSLAQSKERPAQVNVAAPMPGGDAFKQQLAAKVASGDMSLEQLAQIFPSRGQAGSQQRSEIVQMAAKMNPNLDLTGSSATYKNRTNHNTVTTAKYIDNLNTNLGMLDSAVDTLGSGDWNTFNKLKMRAGGEFGNTNVSNYNALHSVMVNEAARALSGNGSVSDAARKEASSIIPQFGSPQQVHQAIATLRQELANRKSTLLAPVQYGQQGQQAAAGAPAGGLPNVGGMYNGERVLKVTKIK